MPRNVALVRTLSLMQRLQRGRATLKELAEEFKVTTRTIRRDLVALQDAGIPVRNTSDAYANGINGFWWVDR